MDELAQDGAVASLLLIHDLYPVPLEQRVLEALDTVRPYMESHGGNVELLGIEDGVARLALQGSCNGCAASRATLELAIKQALEEHAPDLAGLEVEGVTEPSRSAPAPGGFELPMVHSDPATRATSSPLDGAPARAGCRSTARLESSPGELAGARRSTARALLLANVDGSLLAYRDECAACGASLRDGELDGRDAPLPELRGRVRPAAGRSRRRRRAAPADAGAAARRRAASGWRCEHASTRSSRRAGAPRRSRGCARSRRPGQRPQRLAGRPRAGRGALRYLQHRGARRPPPPAPARGAADRVRVRGVLGASLRRRRVPPDGDAHALARAVRVRRGDVGRGSRSRSGSRSSCAASVTGGVVAFYPSPAGATESELEPRRVGRARRAQPGARASSTPTPRR